MRYPITALIQEASSKTATEINESIVQLIGPDDIEELRASKAVKPHQHSGLARVAGNIARARALKHIRASRAPPLPDSFRNIGRPTTQLHDPPATAMPPRPLTPETPSWRLRATPALIQPALAGTAPGPHTPAPASPVLADIHRIPSLHSPRSIRGPRPQLATPPSPARDIHNQPIHPLAQCSPPQPAPVMVFITTTVAGYAGALPSPMSPSWGVAPFHSHGTPSSAGAGAFDAPSSPAVNAAVSVENGQDAAATAHDGALCDLERPLLIEEEAHFVIETPEDPQPALVPSPRPALDAVDEPQEARAADATSHTAPSSTTPQDGNAEAAVSAAPDGSVSPLTPLEGASSDDSRAPASESVPAADAVPGVDVLPDAVAAHGADVLPDASAVPDAGTVIDIDAVLDAGTVVATDRGEAGAPDVGVVVDSDAETAPPDSGYDAALLQPVVIIPPPPFWHPLIIVPPPPVDSPPPSPYTPAAPLEAFQLDLAPSSPFPAEALLKPTTFSGVPPSPFTPAAPLSAFQLDLPPPSPFVGKFSALLCSPRVEPADVGFDTALQLAVEPLRRATRAKLRVQTEPLPLEQSYALGVEYMRRSTASAAPPDLMAPAPGPVVPVPAKHDQLRRRAKAARRTRRKMKHLSTVRAPPGDDEPAVCEADVAVLSILLDWGTI